jgi:acetoin utilization deacetylase AcuC-like enzyme
MGFCFSNHVALAARAAQAAHGLERVAIVDFDVHHGNGTQHIFEEDGNVFYASLHQWPHYPGTGAAEERGIGEGEDTTLNCPLPAGSGNREWQAALEERVLPALDRFEPELLLISAGFDAHQRDLLSETRLTSEAFGHMTRALVDLANQHCEGRVISILEGGYDLVGLSEGVQAHLEVLAS